MKIIQSTRNTPPAVQGGVLAIGNFDGVHKGHQALIAKVRDKADKLQAPAGVMTFEPHPRQVFASASSPPLFRLTTAEQKRRLFKELGLSFLAELQFEPALYGLTADQFAEQILWQGLKPRQVVIGWNFYYGKGRSGSPETLSAAGKALGFKVSIIPPVKQGDIIYSSTAIREYLRQGDLRAARDQLGYFWRVTGRVAAGAGLGKTFGFPTANLELAAGQDIRHGIYAVQLLIDGQTACNGAAYIGPRPTLDNGAPRLEVFIFDFDQDLYGRTLEIAFIEFLRADEKFASTDDMIGQMKADCQQAQARLATLPALTPAFFPAASARQQM